MNINKIDIRTYKINKISSYQEIATIDAHTQFGWLKHGCSANVENEKSFKPCFTQTVIYR